MPRPRTNDPLGVSDNPVVVTDPVRADEIVEEFKRRMAWVRQSYMFSIASLGSDRDFNASLRKMHRSLARKRPAKHRGERAHPELETVISILAKQHARTRTGTDHAEVTQEDANAGARRAAEIVNPRPGRARNSILREHVHGLMALLQETTGKPVQVLAYKDNIYHPQASGVNGTVLVDFFQAIDPGITVSTLASIVKAARRQYAGKPMRFRDFYPLYGYDPTALDGKGTSKFGWRVEHFEPNIPIYFP